MVANFWLRSGDSHSSNNFFAFLEETLRYYPKKFENGRFYFGGHQKWSSTMVEL
jgi:hypothetical protein